MTKTSLHIVAHTTATHMAYCVQFVMLCIIIPKRIRSFHPIWITMQTSSAKGARGLIFTLILFQAHNHVTERMAMIGIGGVEAKVPWPVIFCILKLSAPVTNISIKWQSLLNLAIARSRLFEEEVSINWMYSVRWYTQYAKTATSIKS